MNAVDRLARSMQQLPQRMGDAVTVCGQPLRGLFTEQAGDALALGFVQGEPQRTATLQLALSDVVAINPRDGDPVQAAGESWQIVPPLIRRDGFLVLTLEHQP